MPGASDANAPESHERSKSSNARARDDESVTSSDPALAIGLIAVKADGDALLREALRARWRGYPVLVTDERSLDREIIRLLEQLGVTFVTPSRSDLDVTTRRNELIRAARLMGYSTLLVHTELDTFIDYERSRTQVTDDDQFSFDVATTSSIASGAVETYVAIPAYNESATIGSIVEQARSVADEVLVIDDGSSDETARIAADAGASVIEHDRNRGYGAALKTAFLAAYQRSARHLVVIDGDGQHDPRDAPKLVNRQRETGAEVVIGSRFVEGASTDAPLYRRFGLRVINLLANLSLGAIRPASRIADAQSGFRAYNARAIESLVEDGSIGDGMWASTDILYHAHRMNYVVEEVPTTITYDVENGSTRNPITHGYALVRNLLRTIERDRPITVLGAPGFLCTLIGFGAGYWTVSNYVQTETFPLGVGLLTVALVLAGLLACVAAIVLHSLNTIQLSGQSGGRTNANTAGTGSIIQRDRTDRWRDETTDRRNGLGDRQPDMGDSKPTDGGSDRP